MHIISRKTLKAFYEKPGRENARGPLESWFHEAKRASWKSFAEIRARYPSVSVLKSDRAVFNVGGNKYRLIVRIDFRAQLIFIRFVGTHKEYDNINALEV